jgi:hypothetical protein
MQSTRAKRGAKAAPKGKAQRWVYLFAGGKAEGNAKMRALLAGPAPFRDELYLHFEGLDLSGSVGTQWELPGRCGA